MFASLILLDQFVVECLVRIGVLLQLVVFERVRIQTIPLGFSFRHCSLQQLLSIQALAIRDRDSLIDSVARVLKLFSTSASSRDALRYSG